MRTDKPEVCTMWCLLKVCRCLCSLSSDAPFIHWAKHSARLADVNHQPVWCLASCCLNHSASCCDKFWQCLLTDHTRCCPGSFLSALPALVVGVPVLSQYQPGLPCSRLGSPYLQYMDCSIKRPSREAAFSAGTTGVENTILPLFSPSL